ncbi:MAG: type VI secretion system tube protein Hcp [Pseudomonadota bacterium]
MSTDMFIKIGNIEGEAIDSVHKKEIDILGWSWGMSNSGSAHSGSGAGAGKASVQDLTFTKFLDKSTPNLMMACVKGTHFPEADLTIRKAGETPLEYVKIKLTEVLVTAVSAGGGNGQTRLTETITLNFAKFELAYQAQNDKGGKEGGEIFAKYSISENKAF